MRQLNPGNYEGRIKNYGVSRTKTANKPQAFITFEIDKPEGGTIDLTWFGGLDPKPKTEGEKAPSEWTIKTLLDCGYSSADLVALGAGPDSNCMEVGKIMELAIVDNTWEGNTNSQIRFINIPGQVRGPKRVSIDELASMPEAGALRAQLMRERAKSTGATPPVSPI